VNWLTWKGPTAPVHSVNSSVSNWISFLNNCLCHFVPEFHYLHICYLELLSVVIIAKTFQPIYCSITSRIIINQTFGILNWHAIVSWNLFDVGQRFLIALNVIWILQSTMKREKESREGKRKLRIEIYQYLIRIMISWFKLSCSSENHSFL